MNREGRFTLYVYVVLCVLQTHSFHLLRKGINIFFITHSTSHLHFQFEKCSADTNLAAVKAYNSLQSEQTGVLYIACTSDYITSCCCYQLRWCSHGPAPRLEIAVYSLICIAIYSAWGYGTMTNKASMGWGESPLSHIKLFFQGLPML